MKKLHIVLLFITHCSFGQIIGPMVAYSEEKEVKLWVQTSKSAKIQVLFWEENTTKKQKSEIYTTEKKDFFVVHILLSDLNPGKKYQYEVLMNGILQKKNYPLTFQTQAIWRWHTPPPNFSFVFGTCLYVNDKQFDRPGKPYGSNFEILQTIYNQHPDFMVWGGDNTYYREGDWNTRNGLSYRQSHTRKFEAMQPLLGAVHHYGVWDDHDYGANDSDRGFWMKNAARDIFKLYFPAPNYIFENEGITHTFFWGDVQFFMMDDRWWKSPNGLKTGEKAYLGKKQLDWLIDALKYSQATFKFIVVGGQVLNPTKIFENYACYENENKELIDRITEEKIKGILFLSGDRHHTEIIEYKRTNTYSLLDITSSSLTSGVHKPTKEEENVPRLEETLVVENNFIKFDVKGESKNRELELSCINAFGKIIWKKTILQKQLE